MYYGTDITSIYELMEEDIYGSIIDTYHDNNFDIAICLQCEFDY